ncbi:type VII secretion protein EccB [Streptomyces sp. NBC_01237]|uniref:type VII secretion protein EccB n=1 Tax=Streptomyces sp. NBC_01237 TaxID=2903790 RepID=UPI002DDB7ADF|nr:type VII secretion protein EccB [Streptomyces sp. NBC_01237]WRZ71275.1 type VII secretion protein EccB [Streptomyces sp. NBC_01237]
MQSRRDQVHAHMFVMSRLSLGMLRDDPDAPESAHRRTSKGFVIGLVVAALAALIVAVYGLVVPGGSNAWKATGTLVIDERSGARYLTLDGVLHPVLNETSARLLAGDRMKVVSVKPASLQDAPRGATLGIVGAPDPLPQPGSLSRAAWSVCATRTDAAKAPLLTVAVGLTAEGRPVTSDRATLVRSVPGDATYLLWHGTRLRLNTANYAVQSLGYDPDGAYPVPDAFLNALPAGPDLAVPEVTGRGKAGPSLAGRATRVGQLFEASGRHYLLTERGLTRITALEEALLKGDPRTQRTAYAGGPVELPRVGPDDLARHQDPKEARLVGASGGAVPTELPGPRPVAAGEGVCAVIGTADGRPTISVVLPRADAVGGRAVSNQPGITAGSGAADLFAVRPEGGALVTALSSAGTGTAHYLVTESGAKYPVPGGDKGLQRLGYSAEQSVPVPSGVLGMLASGPALDDTTLLAQGLVEVAENEAPQ